MTTSIPDHFICPISTEVMVDPVVPTTKEPGCNWKCLIKCKKPNDHKCTHVFERAALEEFMKRPEAYAKQCPLCARTITAPLKSNQEIKEQIAKYAKDHPEVAADLKARSKDTGSSWLSTLLKLAVIAGAIFSLILAGLVVTGLIIL